MRSPDKKKITARPKKQHVSWKIWENDDKHQWICWVQLLFLNLVGILFPLGGPVRYWMVLESAHFWDTSDTPKWPNSAGAFCTRSFCRVFSSNDPTDRNIRRAAPAFQSSTFKPQKIKGQWDSMGASKSGNR